MAPTYFYENLGDPSGIAAAGQRIEVAGDEPTPQHMEDALAAATGQPVRYQPMNPEEVRNEDIAAMYRYLERTGYQADIRALHDRFPEVRWTSFAVWAREATK